MLLPWLRPARSLSSSASVLATLAQAGLVTRDPAEVSTPAPEEARTRVLEVVPTPARVGARIRDQAAAHTLVPAAADILALAVVHTPAPAVARIRDPAVVHIRVQVGVALAAHRPPVSPILPTDGIDRTPPVGGRTHRGRELPAAAAYQPPASRERVQDRLRDGWQRVSRPSSARPEDAKKG